jgi:hypothetical protein
VAQGWLGVTLRDNPGNLPDIANNPYSVRCPVRYCYYAVCATTEEQARQKLRDHKCPYSGGTTKIGWSMTKTLVEKVWDRADELYAQLQDFKERFVDAETSPRVFCPVRGGVKELCWTLSIFMVPHFTTPKEVADELARRYDAKKNGDTDYQTAGLGELRYSPPPGTPYKYRGTEASQPPKQSAPARVQRDYHEKPKPTGKKWKQADWEAVRSTKDKGFPAEKIAQLYRTTAEEIIKVWNW